MRAKELRQNFKERGYPNKVLKSAHKRALLSQRTELLKNHYKNSEKQIRLIGNYDIAWPRVKSICDRFWPLLRQDPHLAPVVASHASITSRRSKNIGDIWGRVRRPGKMAA